MNDECPQAQGVVVSCELYNLIKAKSADLVCEKHNSLEYRWSQGQTGCPALGGSSET